MATKTKTPAKKQAKSTAQRATVLSYSVTSVGKALGAKGWETADAVRAINALCKGEVAASTVTTAISDGRSAKYRKGAASLTSAELAQLKKAAAR